METIDQNLFIYITCLLIVAALIKFGPWFKEKKQPPADLLHASVLLGAVVGGRKSK